MALQTFTLFMSVGTGRYTHGQIHITDYEPSVKQTEGFERRLLRSFELETHVPEFDLRTLEIEALEQSVIQERADSQVRVNLLLDRISQLKAITHEVAE